MASLAACSALVAAGEAETGPSGVDRGDLVVDEAGNETEGPDRAGVEVGPSPRRLLRPDDPQGAGLPHRLRGAGEPAFEIGLRADEQKADVERLARVPSNRHSLGQPSERSLGKVLRRPEEGDRRTRPDTQLLRERRPRV